MSGNGREVDSDVLRRLDEVGQALTDLGGLLAREEEIGRVLQRSVNQVIGAVPGADMASVSVLRGDAAETAASTSERVWAIDSEQYAAGEGPCLEAARTGQFVRVGVAEARERWPAFARSARAAGVKSFLSAPLFIDEKFAGSLNLYGRAADSFDDLDESLVRLYTAAAAAAIANARRYAEARGLAENLRRAIESRAVIDQAIGMLMATRRLDAETAFQILARESQNTNTKLRDVAARVVDAARRPRSGPGGAGLRAAATGTQPAAYGLSVLWQEGLGRSALETSLLVLPFAAGNMLTASNTYRCSRRHGRTAVLAGIGAMLAGRR